MPHALRPVSRPGPRPACLAICACLAACLLLVPPSTALANPGSGDILNPTRLDYRTELVRVRLALPKDTPLDRLQLRLGDQSIPYDLWPASLEPGSPITGTAGADLVAYAAVDLGPGQTAGFAFSTGEPAAATGQMRIARTPTHVELSNGLVGLRLPNTQDHAGGPVPAPLQAVRIRDGSWLGRTEVQMPASLQRVETTVGTGRVCAQARVVYTFDKGRYELSVLLPPDRPYAIVHESFHGLPDGSHWRLDLAAGWKPRQAIVQPNNEGMGVGAGSGMPRDRWPSTLAAGQTRMNDRLLNLLPRWSQSFDDGWYFATHDSTHLLGVLPARAGQWRWPHDNKIVVHVRPSADYAGLHLPVADGARYWLLLAGDASLVGRQQDLAVRHTMADLDKINRDYELTWPGMTRGNFSPTFFYGNHTNPTGQRRQQGRAALRDAMSGKTGDLSTLFAAQQNLDPDWYGSYAQFWSSQNPNFFTDFHKLSLALVAQLREHPQFEQIRARAEAIFREDMDHSVTLPGGAGQECPGYQLHAAQQWLDMAPLCQKFLGFNPATWPRMKATGYFLAHSSEPLGGGKRGVHPAGDTHPGRGDPLALARSFGYSPDPRAWTSEELPGFGVILRHRSGTAQETFLSFKAGPNRGHYHGDQLSIHFAAKASPLAVDHHCSYKPRAGQEHMHNRLAFSTPTLPFANMDGYERLIAFQTGDRVDIAVGQVESSRLRTAREFPPEEWDAREPFEAFETPIRYRRTVLLLKAEQDVVVLRDQYWGPELNIHYMLHVLGNNAQRDGAWIQCNGLAVLVAAPGEFAFAPFTWEHDNGGPQKTTGPRLSVRGTAAEFVTVLVPGRALADIKPAPGGVDVGDVQIRFGNLVGNLGVNPAAAPAGDEVTIRQNGRVLSALPAAAFDFNRSQGDIGLFVPDAGYPFGPIPDWLRKQRPAR